MSTRQHCRLPKAGFLYGWRRSERVAGMGVSVLRAVGLTALVVALALASLAAMPVDVAFGQATGAADPFKFDIPARSAILIDADTGQILWEKNSREKLPPASITKIMSMLLVMEALESRRVSLEDIVPISTHAYDMGGSQAYLQPGEEHDLRLMLDAIAIESANDATVAAAEYLAGSEAGFVDAMNARAKELGMKDTFFYNSTGLPISPQDDGNYTSAHDVAVMSRALLAKPEIFEFISRKEATIPAGPKRAKPFIMYNRNKLLWRYSGADGIKTGYTEKAGYCLAATAKKSGLRLIAVVMRTDSEEARFEQSARLLDYGYRTFRRQVVVKKSERAGEIIVRDAANQRVPVVAARELAVLFPRGPEAGKVTRELVAAKGLRAPLSKSKTIGWLVAKKGGKELARVPVTPEKDVKRANALVRFFRWLWQGIVHIVTFGRR